jgi:hypothetical protein
METYLYFNFSLYFIPELKIINNLQWNAFFRNVPDKYTVIIKSLLWQLKFVASDLIICLIYFNSHTV